MVKTTSGATELERPRIRIATELGFERQVLGEGAACTHALEALMILGFLRGLSDSDRLIRRAEDDISASRSAPVTRVPAVVQWPPDPAARRAVLESGMVPR